MRILLKAFMRPLLGHNNPALGCITADGHSSSFAGSEPVGIRSTSRTVMSTSKANAALTDLQQLFGRFTISAEHIFYTSDTGLSKALVNLRPIVPGHVLVIPSRVVARMEDLTTEEYADLWMSVRNVQKVIERVHGAQGSNVAVQDGRDAGQSVPHVHVHILPRVAGDFARNDDVYDELQDWAPLASMERPKVQLDVPDDSDRKDRTVQQMTDEASIYRDAF